jgi:Fe-S oxidoreductase
LLVEKAVHGGEETVLKDPLLWACLTCKHCTEICPSVVYFSEFIQEARQIAREKRLSGVCTHGGMIQTWIKMMADPEIHQNRLGWIGEDQRISQDSDTIYFTGCLPYYDAAFEDLEVEGIEIARSGLKILNHLGIVPQVLDDERCCGHDQYWQGDMETFQSLATMNLETLTSSGAKRIITTCPECAYTLKTIYPEQIGDTGLQVMHISELLAESDLMFHSEEMVGVTGSATFQDPCRLGRHGGIYQQPRDLIRMLGYNLVEMKHHQGGSLCCGTSCWSNCGQVNKRVQLDRLREATSTGAEVLVTACLKCQIHFRCAQQDPDLEQEIQIPVRDLTTLIAERL